MYNNFFFEIFFYLIDNYYKYNYNLDFCFLDFLNEKNKII